MTPGVAARICRLAVLGKAGAVVYPGPDQDRKRRASRMIRAILACVVVLWGVMAPAQEFSGLARVDMAGSKLSDTRQGARLVLTLSDLEGHTAAEVAALTGWSRGGVKVRIFRARRRLRAAALSMGLGPGQERS